MTNKQYYIKSNHSVYIDDYNKGEGKQVNDYNLNAIISAETPKEAIIKYFDKELYFNFDINYIDNDGEGAFYYSNLVDEDNIEANERDIKEWKEGKKILYSNCISITIYELNKITEI